MGTLHDLRTARRELRGPAALLAEPKLGVIDRKGYKIELLADGTVRLSLVWPNGSGLSLDFDEPHLELFQAHLRQALLAGRARRRVLCGADRWLCAPVPGDDAFLVRHGDAARIFVPCTARKPHRCASCGDVVGPGDLYREREEKSRPRYQWTAFPAHVRLCVACITVPAPAGLAPVPAAALAPEEPHV